MNELKIPCDVGEVSDGYHTFNELYEHRIILFISLMIAYPKISWRANSHSDGTCLDGCFIAGMYLPTGDIRYHLPVNTWEYLNGEGISTYTKAPKWDGHTSEDVLCRLKQWINPCLQLNDKNDPVGVTLPCTDTLPNILNPHRMDKKYD